jgi:hypothetical protein
MENFNSHQNIEICRKSGRFGSKTLNLDRLFEAKTNGLTTLFANWLFLRNMTDNLTDRSYKTFFCLIYANICVIYANICVIYANIYVNYTNICIIYNNICVIYANICIIYNNICIIYNNIYVIYANICIIYNNICVIYVNICISNNMYEYFTTIYE